MFSRPWGETMVVADAAMDDTGVTGSVVEGVLLPDADVTTNAVL